MGACWGFQKGDQWEGQGGAVRLANVLPGSQEDPGLRLAGRSPGRRGWGHSLPLLSLRYSGSTRTTPSGGDKE